MLQLQSAAQKFYKKYSELFAYNTYGRLAGFNSIVHVAVYEQCQLQSEGDTNLTLFTHDDSVLGRHITLSFSGRKSTAQSAFDVETSNCYHIIHLEQLNILLKTLIADQKCINLLLCKGVWIVKSSLLKLRRYPRKYLFAITVSSNHKEFYFRAVY